ncbi:MAG: hypothetical protein DBX38_00680 [Eubacteriales Family XIII. Incertae Sedis bacterium]|nr:MAG: hypothetical protein DBX38_00680 [Clostridiales Family XIII bacterium]
MKGKIEMKRKIISILLALTFVIGSSAAVFAEDSQIDYSQWDSQSAYPSDVVNTPIFAAVKFLMDKKIISGYDDGLFHADRNITRAEFTKMMVIATNNQNGMDQRPDAGFTDIENHWAKDYINTGTFLKFINGMGDGTFAPDGNVTYAQVIAIIVRSKGVTDAEMSAYGKWPDNYAKYATMYNMTGDVTVSDWDAPASRGDVAKILYRNLPK